jgi:hypothetical protein
MSRTRPQLPSGSHVRLRTNMRGIRAQARPVQAQAHPVLAQPVLAQAQPHPLRRDLPCLFLPKHKGNRTPLTRRMVKQRWAQMQGPRRAVLLPLPPHTASVAPPPPRR